MYSEILIPDFSDSTTTAEVSKIYVNEGQSVGFGDLLFEVETDKVILEVPAPESGIIEKFTISQGDHVSSQQIAMLLRKQLPTDTPVNSKEVEPIEYIQEQSVKDDIERDLLAKVVGNSLFDQRGIICGLVGLVVGVVLGAIVTTIVIG